MKLTHTPLLLLLPLALATPGAALAQGPTLTPSDWLNSAPFLPRLTDVTDTPTDAPAPRANRIRLFRLEPAFAANSLGLDEDDLAGDTPPEPAPDWVQVSMGNDNPFFDFRRRGDPGGVGYYRVDTQVQLLNTPTTGLAINLKAVTPLGREYDGLSEGPTVVRPGVSLFHALDDGTAFQGFLGKNVHMETLGSQFNRSWEYALAVHRPLATQERDGLRDVYVFVEALGRYRYDPTTGATNVWEVVPGVQWRLNENWWVSGGFVVPVKSQSASDSRLWQVTCSLQF
jgi:hypothetical protein